MWKCPRCQREFARVEQGHFWALHGKAVKNRDTAERAILSGKTAVRGDLGGRCLLCIGSYSFQNSSLAETCMALK